MKNSQISIETKGRHARINVDGHELDGVRGYCVSHDAKGIPIIQLSLLATDVTFDSDTIPELPEPYNELYISKQKLVDSGLILEEQIDSIMGEIADELEKTIPSKTIYANADTVGSENLRKLDSKSLEKALESYNKIAEKQYRYLKIDVIQWAALILSISAILISLINLLH